MSMGPIRHAIAVRLASPYLHLTVVALFFAGNMVAARAVNEHITPVSLNFWRWAASALFIIPVAAPKLWASRRVILREWKFYAVMGLMGITLFHSFLYVALTMTMALNVSMLSSVTPILIVLIAWVWIHERISPRQGFGVAVSLVGVLTIVVRGDWQVLMGLRVNAGDLWALGSVPMWAIYTVMLRRHKTDLDSMTVLAAIILFGTAMLGPLFVWDVVAGQSSAYNLATVSTIVYVSLFGSVISYWLWNRSVVLVGANKAALFMHLIPVFTALLAILLLGEQAHIYHGVGIVLIFCGIYFVTAKVAAGESGQPDAA